MKKALFSLFAFILLFQGSITASASPEVIDIYSYHNHPPFVTGSNTGWTYDLAAALNKQAEGSAFFKVKIVPRSRLNHYLKGWIQGECPATACQDGWIVPWVNPKWGFIKGARDNYRWHPLFQDSNSIITLKKSPLIYTGPESLKGHVLAGTRGHRYVGIDPLVKAGEIKRIDGNKERDNILKLLRGRVDATLLPTSTVEYLLKKDTVLVKKAEQLRIAGYKHQVYMRHIMLPETRADLLGMLESLHPGSLEFIGQGN